MVPKLALVNIIGSKHWFCEQIESKMGLHEWNCVPEAVSRLKSFTNDTSRMIFISLTAFVTASSAKTKMKLIADLTELR